MDSVVNIFADVVSKYDNYLILGVLIVNSLILLNLMVKLKKANEIINPVSDKRYNVSANMDWNNVEVSRLSKMRSKLVSGYVWYANLTAIFPLLGILGTVAALVTYSAETMMDNFMVALSTTLFGVFCAIIFKALDSLVAGQLDIFLEDADHIIQNFEVKERDIHEA